MRFLLRIFLVASILLSGTFLALYIRSYFAFDELYRGQRQITATAEISRHITLSFYRARIYLLYQFSSENRMGNDPSEAEWQRHSYPPQDPPPLLREEGDFWRSHGFIFATETRTVPDATFSGLSLMLPHLFLVLLFVSPALVFLATVPLRKTLLRRHRARHNLCPRCAYDLRATPTRCPECGTSFSEASPPTPTTP